mmetsp:Transcript_28621/g.66454  ORF Transcript_28621/g.66454 Transcript_28621/m.66454 type:complete len:368 (+) Transcript_28621:1807-2910(+)
MNAVDAFFPLAALIIWLTASARRVWSIDSSSSSASSSSASRASITSESSSNASTSASVISALVSSFAPSFRSEADMIDASTRCRLWKCSLISCKREAAATTSGSRHIERVSAVFSTTVGCVGSVDPSGMEEVMATRVGSRGLPFSRSVNSMPITGLSSTCVLWMLTLFGPLTSSILSMSECSTAFRSEAIARCIWLGSAGCCPWRSSSRFATAVRMAFSTCPGDIGGCPSPVFSSTLPSPSPRPLRASLTSGSLASLRVIFSTESIWLASASACACACAFASAASLASSAALATASSSRRLASSSFCSFIFCCRSVAVLSRSINPSSLASISSCVTAASSDCFSFMTDRSSLRPSSTSPISDALVCA